MHAPIRPFVVNREAQRRAELTERYSRSRALFERASGVIPGGIHLSGKPLVDTTTTPMYFERGSGSSIFDVDGHRYTDYLMAFGAVFLGYARKEVDQAAQRQLERGGLLSLNHPLHAELIERLLPLLPGAEMGVFFKTGSEATTAALRIARQYTGRRSIARAGYHGWHDWCLPLESFVPRGLETQVLEYRATDPDSLSALFAAHPDEIAAVILAPEMVIPFDPATIHELCRIARAHGALFIMDEVKTGLRVSPGSICARVGCVPDLITVSKALGNGWALALTAGARRVMQAAAGMHYSATFHGDTAAMAAALETLWLVQQEAVQQHAEQLGQRLIDGLNAIVASLGVPAVAYPEPVAAMPFFRFQHPDPQQNTLLSCWFYREVLARGQLLHPRHLWFLSGAHTAEDVERTLAACQVALREALAFAAL